jgi:ribosomal protein L7/L12
MKSEYVGVIGLLAVVVALVAIYASRSTRPREVENLPAPSSEVVALAREGRKIDAIRMYRKQATAGLYEATRVIESIRKGD